MWFAGRGTLLLIIVLSLQSCRRPEAPATHVTKQGADPVFNDTAQFLAGIRGRSGSPFHGLEQTPEWQRYSAWITSAWQRAEKDQFDPINAFQKRELAPLHNDSSFVFYPFSGPDVLYVTHFFPNGNLYVLAGLERVGVLRKPASYAEDLAGELNGWTLALGSIFRRSFFVTSEMDRQFHGRVASGLLPMILLLLARSDHVIEDLHYGGLDAAGRFVPEDAETPARHMGVEIAFHRRNETVTRKLVYFSTKLGPEFEQNPAFDRYLLRLGSPETLVKSASFLLHWQMCSALRSYILEKSNLILEDDTGVPFHYFQNPAWHVELFGEYSRPDRPFHREYQPDLAEAFQDTAVKKLGFNLGYGAGRRPSSLILAVRAK